MIQTVLFQGTDAHAFYGFAFVIMVEHACIPPVN